MPSPGVRRRNALLLAAISLAVLLVVGALIASAVVVATGGDDGGGPAPATLGRPPGLAMPNVELTPGDVLPATAQEICVPGYSSSVRDVSTRTKEAVYASYGITSHKTGEYEVDHLVPLAVGGSNDVKNLWPEPAEPRPGFHEKDRLEVRLHALVCDGELDLATAQHDVATDWYAAYVHYVLEK
jgi:hypothetical protein